MCIVHRNWLINCYLTGQFKRFEKKWEAQEILEENVSESVTQILTAENPESQPNNSQSAVNVKRFLSMTLRQHITTTHRGVKNMLARRHHDLFRGTLQLKKMSLHIHRSAGSSQSRFVQCRAPQSSINVISYRGRGNGTSRWHKNFHTLHVFNEKKEWCTLNLCYWFF